MGVPARTPLGSATENLDLSTGRKILVLADSNAGLENLNGIRAVPWTGLKDLVREMVNPRLVLSPIFGDGFDVFEIAELLNGIGYKSDLRAFGPRLPNKQMIEDEISRAFPCLRFQILTDRQFGDLGLAQMEVVAPPLR